MTVYIVILEDEYAARILGVYQNKTDADERAKQSVRVTCTSVEEWEVEP